MFKEINSHYFTSPSLEIKKSSIEDAGLGCFTTDDIDARVCVERVPVIIFANTILKDFHKLTDVNHVLADYVFLWDNEDNSALALGYGSIYNHSPDPNIFWKVVKNKKKAMEFWTKKKVKKGDELFIKYYPPALATSMLPFMQDEIIMKNLYE